MIKRTFRWMLGAIGALAILLALTVVVARVLLFEVPQRRAEIQGWVSRATGLDFRLQNLSARWGRGGPELYATDIEVYAPNGGPRLARAQAIGIGTDLKRMLLHTELLSGHVRLIGPEVRLVRTVEGIHLEGQPQLRDPADQGPMDSDALPSGSLEIEDGRITLIDARPETAAQPEPIVRLQGLTLKLQRDGDVVKFVGDLDLPKRLGGALGFAGSARGRLDDPRKLAWQFSLAGHRLHLDPWREFLSGRYRKLNPRGEIGTLDLSIAGNGLEAPKFKIDARFAGVGIDPVDRIPGLGGLAGEIKATEKSGEARLNSPTFVLNVPYSFRAPLSAGVRGVVTWEGQDAGSAAAFRIASHQFQVAGAHANAVADVELTIPRDGSARFLKLKAQFKDAVLKEGWRYLPVDRLRNPKTIAWLDKAFLSGRATSGEVFFEGPTNKFPFRDGEGEFRVTAAVEGLDLHYGEGWPNLRNLAVDVEFHNQGLSGVLLSGTLNGLQIAAGARAQIPDFRDAELTVQGQTTGDLSAALGYLQGSPLGETLGATFMSLQGSGPLAGTLDLWLPLKHRDDRKYTVVADLGDRTSAVTGGDRLFLEGGGQELRDLRGKLRIEDKKLIASALKGTYLGGPVAIDLKPQVDRRNKQVTNVVYLRAQTPAAAMAQAWKVPSKIALSGTVDWRAVAKVIPEPTNARKTPGRTPRPNIVTVEVDSTLQGLGVGLPAPLAKTAPESRPMHVEMSWPQPDTAEVKAAYGNLLQAHLNFVKDAAGGEWRFIRGAARLGGGEARALTGTGMVVDGAVDMLDLPGWLGMRGDGTGKRKLADLLRSIDLQIHDLRLYAFHLPDVSARLDGGADAWSVTVDGPKSRGTVHVPFDLTGLQALGVDMTRLDLGDPVTAEGAQAADDGQGPDPRQWPAVKVAVRNFVAWNKKFGNLRAELVRAPNGLTLQSLNATGTTFQVNGTGSWVAAPQGSRSQIALRLESTDVLQTLQDLGYGGSVTGERGLAVMDLNWPGAPDGKLLSRLSGTMKVEVDNGRLVSVQPGAGRVFGLMSMTTLRRRLALDFSDLTDKGLAFDAVRGDFTLRSGDAYTSNLLLRGPAAEIGVVGRTGLQSKDYDQTAVVTGNVGQSLPVAGALAGGPVVGAALLVFSQIFKQPLKGVARGYYRITGPWENPTVERVEADQVKKAAEAARIGERNPGSG